MIMHSTLDGCRKGELIESSLLLSKKCTVFYDVNPFINTSDCHLDFSFHIVFIKISYLGDS